MEEFLLPIHQDYRVQCTKIYIFVVFRLNGTPCILIFFTYALSLFNKEVLEQSTNG